MPDVVTSFRRVGTVQEAERRPRLLFLAYYFPPVNAVACVRTYNMAKWLSRKGWDVTVVTPLEKVWRQPEGTEENEKFLAAAGIRCIRTEHHWLGLAPAQLKSKDGRLSGFVAGMSRRIARTIGAEREAGWLSEASRALACLDAEDVDVILASGPPFAAFGLARNLARRLDRSFVVDYRDLWTGYPYSARSRLRAMIAEENDVLQSSRAVTVASPSIAEYLAGQFGVRDKIRVLTNGYDPEELGRIEPEKFDHFAIVYTGVFRPPKATVEPVMAVLQRMKAKPETAAKKWAFHYYGVHGEHVRSMSRQYGVEDRVVVHGLVSRRESLSAVRGAGMSLVLTSIFREGSLSDRGVVSGKVFDAIGLGTPVLGIAPNGSDLETILDQIVLSRRIAGEDVEEMAAFLEKSMENSRPQARDQQSFSWPTLVDQLHEVLRDAMPFIPRGGRVA